MAALSLKDEIIAILREAKEASTAELISALRKKGITAKGSDINPVVYKDSVFEIARKAATGAPTWRLRGGTTLTAPTFSCDQFSVTLEPACDDPDTIIMAVIQAVAHIDGLVIKCGDSPYAQRVATIAADYGVAIEHPTAHAQGYEPVPTEEQAEFTPEDVAPAEQQEPVESKAAVVSSGPPKVVIGAKKPAGVVPGLVIAAKKSAAPVRKVV